jgi:adenine-specific DNA methylase
MIRCPRCGYEMPPEAKLIRWLRKVRARLSAKRLAGRHKYGAAVHQVDAHDL